MEKPTPPSEYLTLTEIGILLFGRSVRRDRARLAYAIECDGIVPARKAGTVRLFHRNDLPRIQGALARVVSRTAEVRHA